MMTAATLQDWLRWPTEKDRALAAEAAVTVHLKTGHLLV
jgi:hypothetical protein